MAQKVPQPSNKLPPPWVPIITEDDIAHALTEGKMRQLKAQGVAATPEVVAMIEAVRTLKG